jgi:hypothetical protein
MGGPVFRGGGGGGVVNFKEQRSKGGLRDVRKPEITVRDKHFKKEVN